MSGSQQKLLWAEVWKETGKWKSRWKVRDLLARWEVQSGSAGLPLCHRCGMASAGEGAESEASEWELRECREWEEERRRGAGGGGSLRRAAIERTADGKNG